MKKKNLILIAAAVTVSLSACGINNDISIPEATTQAESAVSEIPDPAVFTAGRRPISRSV